MRAHYPRRQYRLPPLPIGHRGLLDQAPENTLASFRAARALGVPVVEFDVRLTKDRQIVVFHDADLRRIAGLSKRIADLSFGALRQIDVGVWFAGEFAGAAVPTLGEVLDLFSEETWLLIELKENNEELVQGVCREIEQRGFVRNTMLQSFHADALRHAQSCSAQIHRVLLSYEIPDWSLVQSGLAEAVSLHIDKVTPADLEPFFRDNVPIHAWPVDTEEDLATCLELGVDCIGTNKISFIKRLMDQNEIAR